MEQNKTQDIFNILEVKAKELFSQIDKIIQTDKDNFTPNQIKAFKEIYRNYDYNIYTNADIFFFDRQHDNRSWEALLNCNNNEVINLWEEIGNLNDEFIYDLENESE